MVDISIIEFLVYGLLAYSGIVMLIISAFRETPTTKSQSAARVIWLIPCIIAASLLANLTGDITLDTISTVNTITDNQTSAIIFTEDITKETKITLLQPIWGTLHILIFFVLIIYVIMQVLVMLGRKDRPNP